MKNHHEIIPTNNAREGGEFSTKFKSKEQMEEGTSWRHQQQTDFQNKHSYEENCKYMHEKLKEKLDAYQMGLRLPP